MNRVVYIFLMSVLFVLPLAAQQNKLQTSIDTTKNKIGAQFNLTIKTTVDTNASVIFPAKPNFGALELIRNYKIDTVRKDNRYELIKKYGLTQFDSGKYTIKPIQVIINKMPFYSDSLNVEVANVAVDTLKQKMYDIKDIIPAKGGIGNWWIYLLIVIAIAAIGYLVYRQVTKNQAKRGELDLFKTPIEKATGLLQQLERKELWQKGEVKNYYSELTDIARNYIEEAINIPAMESTTSELIAALRMAAVKKNMSLTQGTVENLEVVLKQADLVKFAKSQPLEYEIADDRKKIEKAIVTLDQSIPETVEDEDVAVYNEAQKQKLIKKQKRKRIYITVGAVVLLTILTLFGFIAVKGYDFVRDNIIGTPTKTLLEGEWIKSEYGTPGVSIETPKVLKRLDIQSIISKTDATMFKEAQAFGYGSIFENFTISVTTLSYKQETQMDLNNVQDGQLRALEAQGMKNILLKNEDYETKDGITGKRVFGTMMMTDKLRGKTQKMYYEVLIFGQENGLQQIVISYPENDAYGLQIKTRVLNSVELRKTGQ